MHYGEYKVELIYEDKDIIKPIVDTRNYKLIKLENNLEVLLISDRNSSICSAALSVEVGSFKDDLIPGLAHFTGHALYLGSKLYPEPSAFENHLNHYFGKSNAFTTDDKTVFYFEVGWQGFEKAIEMFSKMFEEPLFDEANLNLEIDAINSEHENNLNKDSWKENQIIKSLADKNHPYSNFGTGNSDTLRGVQFKKLIEKMKNLYDEYYLPNYMKLVVMTNQNMEQLQYTVSYYFSDLRKTQEQQLIRKINENESEMDNTKNETISYKTKPYSTDNLGQVIWYKKIAGGQHLDVIFILDEIFSKYHIKPLDLISYHFKYSGEGSLINYLKTNKLANKLDVGVVSSFKTFSIYGISLYLNEEGLRKVKDVIQLVFNYLNLIKSNGINQSTYDEIKSSKKVSFKFTEKSDLIREEIARLAANMLNYKQEDHNDILYVDYFHSAFNETVIRKDIGQLEPENSLIIIGSTSFPDGQLNELIDSDLEVEQEQWYGTDYKKNKLTKEYLHTLKSVPITGETFKLRSSNEFITKENDIVSCYGVGIVASYKNNTLQEICQEEFMDLTPKLVIDSKNIKIWHKVIFNLIHIYVSLIEVI